MNTEIFTGKAEAYAKARPGYPDAAVDYIAGLVPSDAAIADIGAGTGKFTELLSKRGYRIFAVEPNADMRAQLSAVLSPYPKAEIVDASAEKTTLPDKSIDVITCAQALHWFDANAFWDECRRIGKPGGIIIAVYNITPGGNSGVNCERSTKAFFDAPIVREFSNPIYYTREKWLAYMTSHSHDPLPDNPNYAEHMKNMNTIFERENIDGFLCREVITKVYSERL